MNLRTIPLSIMLLFTSMACSLLTGYQENASISPDTADTAGPSMTDQNTTEAQPGLQNQESIPGDSDGTILYSPLRSTSTYLIDTDGNLIHSWSGDYFPGNSVYLLENGNLLRTGTIRNSSFNAGGAGGIVQEIDWNGNVIWEFEYSNDKYLQHHDIEPLPNGNILMIAWEYKTAQETIAAGRDPNQIEANELWPDTVIEVDPSTDQIVWEWHVWDHLVQGYDPSKANYGVPSEHPELININISSQAADWNHTNSIDYNPELDQILLSVHNFSEIWIIDHATTTAEAAGPAGDLLYRWGNPQMYGAGTQSDQQLFLQHDAQWIEPGLPGEGNILIFNNGDRRNRPYSSIDEIKPPLNQDGSYTLAGTGVYAPDTPAWSYQAENPADFYATNISGAQRLPDGNTLICNGPGAELFEVTPTGTTVWNYSIPYGQGTQTNNTNGEQTSVFRAVFYPADYAGLAGRELIATTDLLSDEQGIQSQPYTNQAGSNRPVGPKAIEACTSLNPGDTCTFSSPKGSLTGTCTSTQEQLACLPTGVPPGNR